MRTIALAGNPNCGKTTLFNRLTGANQHVGNWAGVTVERKEGFLKDGQARIVDLPGIYALAFYTLEERVARDYLLGGDPDAVLNLVDGTALERGLYLTLQLLETGAPLILAVGMMDEVRAGGGAVDCAKLQQLLQIPVIPIAPRKGENLELLADALEKEIKFTGAPRYHSRVERAISDVSPLLAEGDFAADRLRFYTIRVLENDENIAKELGITPKNRTRLTALKAAFEQDTGMDAMTAIADARYRLIEELVRKTVRPLRTNYRISEKIDAVALHRFWALPIFFAVMFSLFAMSFGSAGQGLKGILECDLAWIAGLVSSQLPKLGVSAPVVDLFVNGVLGGVGLVLTFLPQIALVFLFLTLLEECGYLSRAAFLMDFPLRKLGLTGKSFIPMLMGFGCTAPAVMAARTLENERDRRMTILLTPYLSCSARFPIYLLFAGVFFPRGQGLTVGLLYLLSILTAIACGIYLKKGPFRGTETPFLMEFPPYRMPSLGNVLRNTGKKCGDFLCKAGTLIFLMSVSVWLLQHFDARFQFTTDAEASIFSLIGGWIAPLFSPLGFGNRIAAAAILAGIASKEAVVATFGVSCGAGGSAVLLGNALQEIFTPLSAASFLTFCALYMPCISAFATMRRELNSLKTAVLAVFAQTLVAYGASLAVYQLGMLWGNLFR